MEQFLQLLKEINIAQVFVIFVGIWFFYTRLDERISKLEDKMEDRFSKLEDKVEDIDRRLCRIEGSLATQGHCLFSHQNHPEKKAE